MLSYWRDHPPLHVLLGAVLLKQPSSRNDFAELAQAVAAAGGSSGKKLPAAYRTLKNRDPEIAHEP